MGMSRDAYLSQLQALLPSGPAWTRDPQALLTRLLDSLAEELARVDDRAAALIDEADPRTTYEMLADWERVAGLLPYSQVDGTPLSIAQRRDNLISRMTEIGGQSPAYFIALAAKMGFTVTITEFREWNVGDDVEAGLYGSEWNFAWRINTPQVTAAEWSVEDDVEAPFAAIWLNTILESVLHEDKPAHTVLLFNYY